MSGSGKELDDSMVCEQPYAPKSSASPMARTSNTQCDCSKRTRESQSVNVGCRFNRSFIALRQSRLDSNVVRRSAVVRSLNPVRLNAKITTTERRATLCIICRRGAPAISSQEYRILGRSAFASSDRFARPRRPRCRTQVALRVQDNCRSILCVFPPENRCIPKIALPTRSISNVDCSALPATLLARVEASIGNQ